MNKEPSNALYNVCQEVLRLEAINQELVEALVSFTKSDYIKKQHPKRYAKALAAISKAKVTE